MTDPALVRQWALCGIAAAAARFVPVPLLDDLVRERATRTAVLSTLRAHGRAPEGFEPLWGDAGVKRGWLRRRVRKLTTRLVLFPVRKYAALFGAVRGVPTDVLRVVLLARTVDRLLDRGQLRALPDDAARTRRAVERAIDGSDLRVLRAALSDVLSQSRGLSTAAVQYARQRFAGDAPEAAAPVDTPLARGAEQVTGVLARPEIAQLLDRYDAEVDAQLARA